MSTQKIFFSYSRADSPFALTLAKDLREAGADIWIDQLDIPPGSHWDAAVEKALNSASFVLVILTPSSTASTNVMDEVSFALESGKKIIPVLLEDCLPPFRLRRLQRIDFTADYASGFTQLLNSLGLSPGTSFKPEGAQTGSTLAGGSLAPNSNDEQEREKRDNNLWEEACRLNSIPSYRKYLHESPNGLFTDEAKLMIKQLEVEQKEEELEALLWQRAKNEHSKKLYLHYLEEHPQGNYKTLALAAIAEFEKAELAEALKLKEIAAQKAKEEKERADQIERERAQKAKEEKELQDQRDREKAQKEKAENEQRVRLEKEQAEKARVEKERLAAIEREKTQKEKAEKERLAAIEREKAQKEKAEKERLATIEREKAQKEKAEKERLAAIEREKAQKEKEERERLKKEEKEKILLAKAQEKERIARERKAQGLPPLPEGQGKKYALIGVGVLLLGFALWMILKPGSGDDERGAWKDALNRNDSTAFATFMASFPEGKYYPMAKQRIDSIYWVNKAIQDSIKAVDAVMLAAATPGTTEEPPQVMEAVTPESTPAQTTETNPKTNTQATPKANTPSTKPATKPAVKPTNKPAEKSANQPLKVTLGQEYGGGIVIYASPKGDHGMLVSSKEVGSVNWDKASKICAAYKAGGVNGWRLPSKDELNIIYQNRKHLGDYTKGGYWSASEEGKNNAWMQNFSNGNVSKANKQTDLAVRAVRPF